MSALAAAKGWEGWCQANVRPHTARERCAAGIAPAREPLGHAERQHSGRISAIVASHRVSCRPSPRGGGSCHCIVASPTPPTHTLPHPRLHCHRRAPSRYGRLRGGSAAGDGSLVRAVWPAVCAPGRSLTAGRAAAAAARGQHAGSMDTASGSIACRAARQSATTAAGADCRGACAAA